MHGRNLTLAGSTRRAATKRGAGWLQKPLLRVPPEETKGEVVKGAEV